MPTIYMSYNLVLNSNNAINNSTFRYNFINGFMINDEAELCVASIQIPYSWFNVTQAYNNNTFTILFPNPTGDFIGTVILPDGFYTVTDINAYLQQFCITNGLYLINALGQYVYYLTLLYNTTYYGVQLVAQLVPTSLPGGWSQPANWVGYNADSYTPRLVISDNNFGKIIGFEYGLYPVDNTADSSILNTFTPLGSNVNSIIVRCSLVDNQIGVPTDILDTFPINATFGSNINYAPQASFEWIKITPGIHQYLIISFVDQNLNALAAQDPNVTISLLLNNKGKSPTMSQKEKVIEKLNIKI